MAATRVAHLVVAVLLAFSGSSAHAEEVVHDVEMQDDIYVPAVIEVASGDTVRWTNTGPVNAHTVTTQEGAPEPFDSGTKFPTQEFVQTFTKPGVYAYYCRFHGQPDVPPDPEAPDDEQPCGMCGLVTVEGGPTPTPAPTPMPTAAPPPAPTARPTPVRTPTPEPTGTPEVQETPSVTPQLATPSPRPTPERPDLGAAGADGGGGGPRTAAVVLVVLAFGGAGAVAWRSLLPQGLRFRR